MITMKCDCCQTAQATLRRGFCDGCAAVLTKISEARIKEIWDNRSQLTGTVTTTEDERKIVISLWDRIPSGESNWMSGFYCFRNWGLRDDTKKTPKRLTRIYANGQKVTEYRDEPLLIEQWQRYNKEFRWGLAQFVDGVCVYDGMGYHGASALERYAAEEITAMTGETASCPSTKPLTVA